VDAPALVADDERREVEIDLGVRIHGLNRARVCNRGSAVCKIPVLHLASSLGTPGVKNTLIKWESN
jgi:hypothetical protein